MPKITVVDTSCLILLDKIGQLTLLQKLYRNVAIARPVADEFGKSIPDWITVIDINKKN